VEPFVVRHNANATGRQIGRSRNGNITTIPAITQQLPHPIRFLVGPFAAPSWCQAAAWTRRPDRRNRVSSTAMSTGAPAGSSRCTTSRANTSPTWSGHQRARAKKPCARL